MCLFHKILIINLYNNNNNNNLKSCCYKLLHLDDLFSADPHKHGWRERGPIDVSWPVFHHFITGVENTSSVSEQQEQRGCQSSVSICQSSVNVIQESCVVVLREAHKIWRDRMWTHTVRQWEKSNICESQSHTETLDRGHTGCQWTHSTHSTD